MQNAQPSLFTRHDTIFGACEGIGEDFGFNAQYLRVALAAMLFWNPLAALGAYAAIALVVLVSRMLFPNPAKASARLAAEPRVEIRGENDDRLPELAAAA